ERVLVELMKALLKADKPSIFFRQLKNMGQLDFWFSRVSELVGIPQNPKYHQEGDVFTHTMMVLDEAAKKRDKVKNPVGFMLSALTHDLGKITATKTEMGELHSYMHEKEGLPLAKEFLHRLTNEKNLIRYVLNMIENHMRPNTLAADNSSVKATNKMFDASCEPFDLIQLALADSMGKTPRGEYEKAEKFLLERLEVYNEIMSRPFVEGADLIKAGLTPGAEFTKLLDYAHKLRLAGVKKESALKQTLAYKDSL
ncbi:MAG: HD domain-containing protein, partial [Ruminococcaceae bacterium]|nr:HD domain-containing protein [Oscillospiraceae bacterium]